MKKIVITGFEPFANEKINPSQELLTYRGVNKNGFDIHQRLLPVTVKEAGKIITDTIEALNPDYLISFGLNGRISHIALERVAINMVDARIPDNNGEQPVDMIIKKDGPVAFWATLPIRLMESQLKAAGIPVKISYSAGTYICNYVMYTALQYIAEKGVNTKAGFIHIPFLPEQCVEHPQRSSMDIPLLKKMLDTLISVL